MSTSITITNRDGTYSITVNEELQILTEYFDQLIIPCLLAAGFGRGTIADCMEIAAQER